MQRGEAAGNKAQTECPLHKAPGCLILFSFQLLFSPVAASFVLKLNFSFSLPTSLSLTTEWPAKTKNSFPFLSRRQDAKDKAVLFFFPRFFSYCRKKQPEKEAVFPFFFEVSAVDQNQNSSFPFFLLKEVANLLSKKILVSFHLFYCFPKANPFRLFLFLLL